MRPNADHTPDPNSGEEFAAARSLRLHAVPLPTDRMLGPRTGWIHYESAGPDPLTFDLEAGTTAGSTLLALTVTYRGRTVHELADIRQLAKDWASAVVEQVAAVTPAPRVAGLDEASGLWLDEDGLWPCPWPECTERVDPATAGAPAAHREEHFVRADRDRDRAGRP